MYVHLQKVTLIYLVHDSVTTCTRSKAGGIPSYKFKWQWSLTAYINIILLSNKPSQNWNDHHLDKAQYIEHTHLTSISVNTYNLFMSQSHWPHCYESRTFLDILINGLYLNFKQKSTVFESRKKKMHRKQRSSGLISASTQCIILCSSSGSQWQTSQTFWSAHFYFINNERG